MREREKKNSVISKNWVRLSVALLLEGDDGVCVLPMRTLYLFVIVISSRSASCSLFDLITLLSPSKNDIKSVRTWITDTSTRSMAICDHANIMSFRWELNFVNIQANLSWLCCHRPKEDEKWNWLRRTGTCINISLNWRLTTRVSASTYQRPSKKE